MRLRALLAFCLACGDLGRTVCMAHEGHQSCVHADLTALASRSLEHLKLYRDHEQSEDRNSSLALIVLLLAFAKPAAAFQLTRKSYSASVDIGLRAASRVVSAEIAKSTLNVECCFTSSPSCYIRHRPLIASATSSAPGHVVMLDFDGVLCDSELELTHSAWRTACELWPDVMSAAAELDPRHGGVRKAWVGGNWSALQGKGEDGLPNWLRQKMRQLRPAVDISFDSLLMMRLCADEAIMSAERRSGERPLAASEILSNWSPEFRDMLMCRYGLRYGEAIERLGRVRSTWLEKDPKSWLAMNSFHRGAADALGKAVAAGEEVYIFTNKQSHLVQALLAEAGIQLDDEHIFGLGSGSKADTLLELQHRHPTSQLRFVDDKIETLRTMCNTVSLFNVQLFFAQWGYSTASQQASVSLMPRVQTLRCSEELLRVFWRKFNPKIKKKGDE